MNKYTYKKMIRNHLTKLFIWKNTIGKSIEKKILFSSFDGKQYSCNPRAISEKMHELYPEFEIVWYLNAKDKYNIVPSYVRVVSSHNDFLKEIATSFCVVNNRQYENWIYKRNRQLFVQTWHGDLAPKKVLYDAWTSLEESKGKPVPIVDNKVTDYCIAGSNLGESVFRKAFRYNGTIIKNGMPRNDRLSINDPSYDKYIKDLLGIDYEKKIVLYAPTFRDWQSGAQKPTVDFGRIVDILNKRPNEKWIGLVRAHVGFTLDQQYGDNIIDVTDYPDMADLLFASDFLVTDYSSCAGDFVLRKRPVVLAIFDYDDYQNNYRSLNMDLKASGFIFALNQESLEKIVGSYNISDFEMASQEVIKKYGIVQNSKSSDKICEIINEQYHKIFNL